MLGDARLASSERYALWPVSGAEQTKGSQRCQIARTLAWATVPVLIALVATGRWLSKHEEERAGRSPPDAPVPVEVAPVIRAGTLEAVREFTGTLEPSAEVVVAAEVAGTVRAVHADLSDQVQPGQLLAELDDREYRQAEAAARAELAVARARVEAAESRFRIATRLLERAEALAARGIASERALDEARVASWEAQANMSMTRAESARARASLDAARLALERTKIRGRWPERDGTRRVSRRYVDEGARVSAGDPLLSLVDTDPLVIVLMASATDYARLAPGQPVILQHEASERSEHAPITGAVTRVAPAFEPQSRQARVEIEVANPEAVLQPGMFVRARAILDRVEGATIVPETALVTRGDRDVVFVVNEDTLTARRVEVEPGLRFGGQVAVQTAGELSGRVVTLGQRRLTDGASVRVIDADRTRTGR